MINLALAACISRYHFNPRQHAMPHVDDGLASELSRISVPQQAHNKAKLDSKTNRWQLGRRFSFYLDIQEDGTAAGSCLHRTGDPSSHSPMGTLI